MKEALASPKDAALKLAQRALSNKKASNEVIYKALHAIKAALAQPTSGDYAHGYVEGFNDACMPKPAQQEPVAFLVDDDLYYPEEIDWETLQEQGHTVAALYTSPPQRKPLTDEQKDILNFLFGLRAIDDVWFGDKHPTERGQYWWRKRLAKAFQEEKPLDVLEEL